MKQLVDSLAKYTGITADEIEGIMADVILENAVDIAEVAVELVRANSSIGHDDGVCVDIDDMNASDQIKDYILEHFEVVRI